MTTYKIIFTGPVGAGKSTAVATLSDIPAVHTDRVAPDAARQRKPETTIAMDYGLVNLSGDLSIHLYGTPDHERFHFMWDILTQGGIGLVLLLDNARADPFHDLRTFVGSFRNFIDKTGVVIGVTRTDVRPYPAIEDYYRELPALGLAGTPIFEIDARKRKDVSLLVEALLCSLDPMASA